MWEFYLLTLAIFGCLNGILVLGFNLQFGHAGIINLAYIVLVAVGAYATAIAGVQPPAKTDTVTHFIGGFGWAFPWDVLFGVGVTVVFAVLLGGVALRRLRHDYLALTLVAIGQGLLVLTTNDGSLFNGTAGVNGVPGPWADQLDPSLFQWVFLGVALVALIVVYFVIAKLTSSPLGRVLKAIREDEDAAASLGKHAWRFKMIAFLIGAAAAGLGGGLFAIYVGGWNVQGWQPGETLTLLAAVIIGGRGRNLGALVGSVILLEGIVQITSFLQIGNPEILPNLQAVAIGLLLLAFLWWRPEGILPEQKEKFARPAVPASIPQSKEVSLSAPTR
jgi:ABC-type branched-subunit amino acid transport system permease subunit